MRVNVCAEEITDRVEIISKEIDGKRYTGLRFYLELPVTTVRVIASSHPAVFDDSSVVTFWGKTDLRDTLRKALELLDKHYSK